MQSIASGLLNVLGALGIVVLIVLIALPVFVGGVLQAHVLSLRQV